MNIPLIIQAVEQIDEAIGMTPNKEKRQELKDANDKLRKWLQGHGVFIGGQHGQ